MLKNALSQLWLLMKLLLLRVDFEIIIGPFKFINQVCWPSGQGIMCFLFLTGRLVWFLNPSWQSKSITEGCYKIHHQWIHYFGSFLLLMPSWCFHGHYPTQYLQKKSSKLPTEGFYQFYNFSVCTEHSSSIPWHTAYWNFYFILASMNVEKD